MKYRRLGRTGLAAGKTDFDTARTGPTAKLSRRERA